MTQRATRVGRPRKNPAPANDKAQQDPAKNGSEPASELEQRLAAEVQMLRLQLQKAQGVITKLRSAVQGLKVALLLGDVDDAQQGQQRK